MPLDLAWWWDSLAVGLENLCSKEIGFGGTLKDGMERSCRKFLD